MIAFENIYLTPEVADLERVREIIKRVPHKNLLQANGENHPGNGLLLAANRGSFIKPCPGQKGNVCCGYWVLEWGMGCIFRCQYCVLQNYIPPGDVTWFMNWPDCHRELDELREKIKGPIRIGSGEFGDSLALEELFPLNAEIIDHASRLPEVTVELKTKSDAISSLQDLPHKEHVIISFSLNPQSFISRVDLGAASLKARLDAARVASEWGYKIAFHFDPLLPFEGWRDAYTEVLNEMKTIFHGNRIAWVSLGTFRFPKGFQDIAEQNHPGTEIFREEFYPCSDGKMRFFRPLREEMYRFMLDQISRLLPQTKAYLCMESPDVWERTTGKPWNSCDLKCLLDAVI